MSWLGNIIGKKSGVNNPNQNNRLNQTQNEILMRNQAMTRDPNYLVESDSLLDSDHDGIADNLEPRGHFSPGTDITGVKNNPNPKTFKPFSFKGKYKNYNVSFDTKGKFVPTATYPLPPVSQEKKLLDRNKRMRNHENKFF